MADKTIGDLPWGSLTILVLFISSVAQVAQTPFERLRPPERAQPQPPVAADLLPVDARLWEDPFAAYERYKEEREKLCEKRQKHAGTPEECEGDLLKRKDLNDWLRESSVATAASSAPGTEVPQPLVIGALVPGDSAVGAEEARRRARYAILAGLQAECYVPKDSSHIGALKIVWSDPSKSASRPALVVPYELLEPRDADLVKEHGKGDFDRLNNDDKRPPKCAKKFSKIAVLWLKEDRLPTSTLNPLAQIIPSVRKAVMQKEPPLPLVLIGPSSSDMLRELLDTVKLQASAPGDAKSEKKPEPPNVPDSALQWLKGTTVLSPSATVPDAVLLRLAHAPIDKDKGVKEYFEKRLGVKFERTIATDDVVLRKLVKELRLRLPKCGKRRIVIVVERDSLYSQAMFDQFRSEWTEIEQSEHKCGDRATVIHPVYYFRGVDGATKGDVTQASDGGKGKTGDKGGSERKAVEWPETRDQLDYLRRMAVSLEKSENVFRARRHRGWDESAGKPEQNRQIGAIGVFGREVHDKLLVLQALREKTHAFDDRIFFTTDMDARYLHPETVGFTRNLIVASSLPLEFSSPKLQAGVPPFRDVYQMSTFLAARRAVRTEGLKEVGEALASPSVYEIGRNQAVPVDGYEQEKDKEDDPFQRRLRFVVSAIFVSALLVALYAWPSAPSLSKLHGDGSSTAASVGAGTTDAWPWMCASYVALIVVTVGSLGEYARRMETSAEQIFATAVIAGIATLLALAWVRYVPSPQDRVGKTGWRLPVRQLETAAVCVAAAWALLPWSRPCDSCEPVAGWLEGVNGWPSHLIHLAALWVILWSLDDLWDKMRRRQEKDVKWLAPAETADASPNPAAPPPGPPAQRLRSWLARCMPFRTWTQHDDHVCFRELWTQYGVSSGGCARWSRVLIQWLGTVGLMYLIYGVVAEGELPEFPIRGEPNRKLISWVWYALVVLLPLLVVVVADATMLACRFIWHLNRHSTVYPRETVEHFANGLGLPQALWFDRDAVEAVASDTPSEHGPTGEATKDRHSLLDDWLDVLVVAQRTELVAPLVIRPFVVLALIVIARSRLLDAWSVSLPFLLGVGVYGAWLIALSAMLKSAAERTRRRSLSHMRATLKWLLGAGPKYAPLVEPYRQLIDCVEKERRGAFASIFDQPLLKALMVPLGSFGGTRLLDQVLLAR